jgi:hypothetical protein
VRHASLVLPAPPPRPAAGPVPSVHPKGTGAAPGVAAGCVPLGAAGAGWLAGCRRRVAGVSHLAAHELCQLGQGQGRPVDLGHKQALQHHLVEVAVRAPDQEAVQLQARGGHGPGCSARGRGRGSMRACGRPPPAHAAAAVLQAGRGCSRAACALLGLLQVSRWLPGAPSCPGRCSLPSAARPAQAPRNPLAEGLHGQPCAFITFTVSFRYTFSLLGASRLVRLLRPPAIRSIPATDATCRSEGSRGRQAQHTPSTRTCGAHAATKLTHDCGFCESLLSSNAKRGRGRRGASLYARGKPGRTRSQDTPGCRAQVRM